MKTRRHAAIRTLIASGEIRSQQELASQLAREGIEVTQATLSRDLSEIGVLKGPEGYQMGTGGPAASSDSLARVLRRELLSVSTGGTLVVLKTSPGHGNVLGVEIDRSVAGGLHRSLFKGLLGTIAGDDTIFVATSSDLAARRLAKELRTLALLD